MKKQLIFLMLLVGCISCTNQTTEQQVLSSTEAEKIIANEVDLGLSVNWADRNLGAADTLDLGGYYPFIKSDTVSALWGNGWRKPTSAEMLELTYQCTWKYHTYIDQYRNHINGYIVTGKNGNSIFLPSAGMKIDGVIYYNGNEGMYATSNFYGSNCRTFSWNSEILFNYDLGLSEIGCSSIRPVRDKK